MSIIKYIIPTIGLLTVITIHYIFFPTREPTEPVIEPIKEPGADPKNEPIEPEILEPIKEPIVDLVPVSDITPDPKNEEVDTRTLPIKKEEKEEMYDSIPIIRISTICTIGLLLGFTIYYFTL